MRWFIVTNMLSASICLRAQTIQNVDFRAAGKTIVVSYDFLHPKADTSINVALVFKDQQGGSIVPKSISGDLKNVKPGEGKRILWDVLEDGISLSGKYKVEISIEVFKSVRIGSQVWTAENLNVDRFRNGDPIPQAKTDEEWKRAGENQQPAWCNYGNDSKNGESYGKLYNWYAVNDRRGLAPQGWHVPSQDEWFKLQYVLGDTLLYGGRTAFSGEKMKSTSGWDSFGDMNGNGTNESGFNGLPGGSRCTSWTFQKIGSTSFWWSSTDGWLNNARYSMLTNSNNYLHYNWCDKSCGFFVRCVKD